MFLKLSKLKLEAELSKLQVETVPQTGEVGPSTK